VTWNEKSGASVFEAENIFLGPSVAQFTPDDFFDVRGIRAQTLQDLLLVFQAQLGSTIEAREALVRRIVDLEIAVLELGRQPVVGSYAETEPPKVAPTPKGKPVRARRRATDRMDVDDRARAS
jgi:hypothetical protein